MTDTGVEAEVGVVGPLIASNHVRQLVRLGERLGAAVESDRSIPDIVAAAAVAMPSTAAVMWVRDDVAGRLHAAGTAHVDAVEAAALAVKARGGQLDLALDDGPLAVVALTGRALHVPVLAPDLLEAGPPTLRELAKEHDLGSLAVVPVRGRRAVRGILVAVRRAGEGSLTETEVDLLRVIGRRGGTSMETAGLLQQVRDRAGLVDSVSDAIVAVDAEGRVTTWNAAAVQLYGIAAAQALGVPLAQSIPIMRFDGEDLDAVMERLKAQGQWRGRIEQTSAAGRVVHVEARATARRSRDGAYLGFVTVMRDLSEVLAAQASAQMQTRFSQELMDALDSRAAVLDRGGAVVTANSRWRGGVSDRDRCVCGPVAMGESWAQALLAAPGPDVAAFAGEVGAVLAGERAIARLECRCLAAGPERATAIEVVSLHGADAGAFVVQSDVSWRRRLQDELSHRAMHDDLTGLPNRAALMERLEASLHRLDGRQMLAVLFCDLDGFKDINDGLGHAVGDQVLVAVARRLRQRCRSADVVARFGGDEFVVVLPVPDVARAVAMADRLVEVLGEPIVVGDAEVAPGASIGIAVVDHCPDVADPVGTLLRDADTAMYHAKERGRGRYEIFDTSLRANIAERLELASALRRAAMDTEFSLDYQTRRLCGSRAIAGVEALLRWSHPVLGPVPPTEFVPIAERTGRIVQVGGWALRRALSQVAELEDRRLSVAVNVSPRQLGTPRFVETVDQALASAGLEPWRLTLEITEGALVDDPVAARAVLGDLRRLGTTIALDDFGTGWSSMSYLRTLPVDVIKIDRSFVADLPTDPDACAVVSAVLGLGHGMGLVVVAEGVERQDQLDVLRDMGCDEYQGFIDGVPGTLSTVLTPAL